MTFLDSLEDRLRSFNDDVRVAAACGQPPRDLNDIDVQDFDEAASRRPSVKPQTQAEIRAWLAAMNPVRWRRMQKDLKYYRKKMAKAGLNPDDFRFML